jgi:hypothetical protein
MLRFKRSWPTIKRCSHSNCFSLNRLFYFQPLVRSSFERSSFERSNELSTALVHLALAVLICFQTVSNAIISPFQKSPCWIRIVFKSDPLSNVLLWYFQPLWPAFKGSELIIQTLHLGPLSKLSGRISTTTVMQVNSPAPIHFQTILNSFMVYFKCSAVGCGWFVTGKTVVSSCSDPLSNCFQLLPTAFLNNPQ